MKSLLITSSLKARNYLPVPMIAIVAVLLSGAFLYSTAEIEVVQTIPFDYCSRSAIVHGDYLYSAGGEGEFLFIYSLEDSAHPILAGSLQLEGIPEQVIIVDDYLVVTLGGASEATVLFTLLDPVHPVQVSTIPHSPFYLRSSGSMIAFNGENGFHFYDLSDPENPFEAGVYSTPDPPGGYVTYGPVTWVDSFFVGNFSYWGIGDDTPYEEKVISGVLSESGLTVCDTLEIYLYEAVGIDDWFVQAAGNDVIVRSLDSNGHFSDPVVTEVGRNARVAANDSLLFVLNSESNYSLRLYRILGDGQLEELQAVNSPPSYHVTNMVIEDDFLVLAGDYLLYYPINPGVGRIDPTAYFAPQMSEPQGIALSPNHIIFETDGDPVFSSLLDEQGYIGNLTTHETPGYYGGTVSISEPRFAIQNNRIDIYHFNESGEPVFDLSRTVHGTLHETVLSGTKLYSATDEGTYVNDAVQPGMIFRLGEEIVETSSVASRDSLVIDIVSGMEARLWKMITMSSYELHSTISGIGGNDQLQISPSGERLVIHDKYGYRTRFFNITDIDHPVEMDSIECRKVAWVSDEYVISFIYNEIRLYSLVDPFHIQLVQMIPASWSTPYLQIIDMDVIGENAYLLVEDRLLVISLANQLISPEDQGAARGIEFQLSPPYPNPFNASVTIPFFLPQSGDVGVRVYNLLGQEVWGQQLGAMPSGWHRTVWDTDGSGVSSGVYILRLEADGKQEARRVTLVR